MDAWHKLVLTTLVFSLLFSIGQVHALTLAPSSISQTVSAGNISNIINITSPVPISIVATANSSAIKIPVYYFNLTANHTFSFHFYTSVSSSLAANIKFMTNTSQTVTLPITYTVNNSVPMPSGAYTINIYGGTASVVSFNSVGFFVSKNNSYVTTGTVLITYKSGNATTFHKENLSMYNIIPTYTFGQISGTVTFSYITPTGQLGAVLPIPVSTTQQIPSALKQPVQISCLGYRSTRLQIGNTSINDYQTTPAQSITCTLFNLQTDLPVSSVAMELNGSFGTVGPFFTDAVGGFTISPEVTGSPWPQGPMYLYLSSKTYSAAPVYFNVTADPNPTVLEYENGSMITSNTIQWAPIVVNTQGINMSAMVLYTNGTVTQFWTGGKTTLDLSGALTITTTAPDYTQFKQSITVSQIHATIAAYSTATGDGVTEVYMYTPYRFILEDSNGNPFIYSGLLPIGGQQIQFTNGRAVGIITSTISDFSASSFIDAKPQFSILTMQPKIELFSDGMEVNQPYVNTLYTVELVGQTGNPIPLSSALTLTQSGQNTSIPMTNGTGTVSFSSSQGATLSFSGIAGADPTSTSTIFPSQPPLPLQYIYIAGVLGVIGIVGGMAHFGHRKRGKSVDQLLDGMAGDMGSL